MYFRKMKLWLSTRCLIHWFAFFLIRMSTTESTLFSEYDNEFVDGRDCARQCEKNGSSLNCYFRFEVELYHSMSKACYNCPYNVTDCFRSHCIAVDGIGRTLIVINRQLPGPSIQVCLGDWIIVDVVNSMAAESTSIHWHGHHQKFTPYMDGVPFVTQCPIAPGTTFRYIMKAAHVGTHFWHSHTGTQRADGAFGAMIVRQARFKEIHADLYDYDCEEHVIQLIDWIHKSSATKFQSHYQGHGTNKPDNILVNGMGQFQQFHMENNVLYTPIAKFNVHQGKRYRFRVINAGVLYCPIQISIDNHTMLIISADGSDLKPIHAESLTVYAGERWDFIVDANKSVDNYWFKFRGLMDCGEKYNRAYSLAVLHYSNADDVSPSSLVKYEDTSRNGMHVNAVNKGAAEQNCLNVAELGTAAAQFIEDKTLKSDADVFLTMSFDFYAVNNSMFHKRGLYGFNQVVPKLRTYTPQINHISMKMPSFPPLSQPESITENTFCNESTVQNCHETFCTCVYKINLPMHSVIELLLIDEAAIYDSNHPFHLHGHSFRVLSIDKLGNHTTVDDVRKYDEAGYVRRNFHDPPVKDTVTVPSGGFTIVRFYTHNPGYWLLHCHLDFHVEVGMAVILKVGEEADFPPIPKNFPRCGNYYPQEVRTNAGEKTRKQLDANAVTTDRAWSSFVLFGGSTTVQPTVAVPILLVLSCTLTFLCVEITISCL